MPDRPEDQREQPRWPLEAFLGERFGRSWEWRESLGCVWFVGLGLVLTLAVGLSYLGVPNRIIQVGTVVLLAGLLVGLWILGRSGRDEE
jgi:hypothetical protein